MKVLIEKRNYIILFIILILLLFLFMKKDEVYIETFKFDKNVLTIMIYDKIDEKKITKNIDEICHKDYNKNVIKNDDRVNYNELYSGHIALKIKEFFRSKNIKKFIINENGDITVGKRYKDDSYKISINDSENKILKIVRLENKSISTIRDDENSISVIGDDIIKNKEYKYLLNSLSIEEGKKFIKGKDIYVLWYIDGNITMSDGFEKYVK